MKPRISMITLGVSDLEESVRFYEQGLGLPRMDSPPEVAFFTLNGSWLGLYGRESLAEDVGVPADGTGFAGQRNISAIRFAAAAACRGRWGPACRDATGCWRG